MKGMNFWDYLAWFALFSTFVWLVLKTLGIINTPAILEHYPIYSAIYIAGWYMQKFDRTTKDVDELRSELRTGQKGIYERLTNLEKDVHAIKMNCPKCQF